MSSVNTGSIPHQRSAAAIMRGSVLGGAFGLLGALVPGCFTGADAQGLPCTDDLDCGKGQSCVEGICGGPGASSTSDTDTDTGGDSSCGDGTVDPGEECDDGNQVDTDACTNACTNAVCGDGVTGPDEECDDGNDVDTDACTNACTNAVCGDGIAGPGEECDDGNDVDTDDCTTACTDAECGDGIVGPGETCDDGEQTAECEVTCQPPTCGDGETNAFVGEECDDGGTEDDPDCMANCTKPLFWDDVEPGGTDPVWTWTKTVEETTPPDPPQGQQVADTWVASPTMANGSAAWFTGSQPECPDALQGLLNCRGALRHESPEIDLTVPDGRNIRLRFEHWWKFDTVADHADDGGILELFVDDAWVVLTPVGGYPNTFTTQPCGAGNSNPLLDNDISNMGWSEDAGDDFVGTEFDLTPYAGKTVKLGFHMGWSCGNDETTDTAGWFVDDIVISHEAP